MEKEINMELGYALILLIIVYLGLAFWIILGLVGSSILEYTFNQKTDSKFILLISGILGPVSLLISIIALVSNKILSYLYTKFYNLCQKRIK